MGFCKFEVWVGDFIFEIQGWSKREKKKCIDCMVFKRILCLNLCEIFLEIIRGVFKGFQRF